MWAQLSTVVASSCTAWQWRWGTEQRTQTRLHRVSDWDWGCEDMGMGEWRYGYETGLLTSGSRWDEIRVMTDFSRSLQASTSSAWNSFICGALTASGDQKILIFWWHIMSWIYMIPPTNFQIRKYIIFSQMVGTLKLQNCVCGGFKSKGKLFTDYGLSSSQEMVERWRQGW